jgi:dimethylsulfone monooxygenase
MPHTPPATLSPLAQAQSQPLMLGLFLPLQKGGWSPSTLPRETSWDFQYNLALTQQAEALGFDLVFGLAQWIAKGYYGGQIDYREETLDPFMAVAAMSAATQRIILISTVHILYGPWHPLTLAKFGSTLDHISGGRWGINVVTGFDPAEAKMFGAPQIAHDKRYAMAEEFTTQLETLWRSTGNITQKGEYWSLNEAYVSPKPVFGRPILVSAGGSPAGLDYATGHADLVFITSPAGAQIDQALAALPDYIKGIRALAKAKNRNIKILINPMIICKPTQAEAEDHYAAIAAHADGEVLDAIQRRYGSADTTTWAAHDRDRRAVGGNVQIIGSPEEVANKLEALHAAGCDGVQIAFYDFEKELAYFGKAVLPLLEARGLRHRRQPDAEPNATLDAGAALVTA